MAREQAQERNEMTAYRVAIIADVEAENEDAALVQAVAQLFGKPVEHYDAIVEDLSTGQMRALGAQHVSDPFDQESEEA